jgi:subtilase family serine protease
VQGISAGWGDIYSWNLPGQSINITGLANGTYRLRSTADPFNRIRETDDGNNASTIRFRLRGRRIILLD